jgi:DNA polymerase-3 subunit gamma/tau
MAVNAGSNAQAVAAPRAAPTPRMSEAAPTPRLEKFEDVVALATEKRDLQIKLALEQYVRPVRTQEGRLEISLAPGAPVGFVNDLSAKLHQWTGKRWVVILSAEQGAPTIKEQKEAKQSSLEQDVRKHPLVEAVLQRFPGAEIVAVRQGPEAAEAPASDSPNFDQMPDMPPDPPDEDERFN